MRKILFLAVILLVASASVSAQSLKDKKEKGYKSNQLHILITVPVLDNENFKEQEYEVFYDPRVLRLSYIPKRFNGRDINILNLKARDVLLCGDGEGRVGIVLAKASNKSYVMEVEIDGKEKIQLNENFSSNDLERKDIISHMLFRTLVNVGEKYDQFYDIRAFSTRFYSNQGPNIKVLNCTIESAPASPANR